MCWWQQEDIHHNEDKKHDLLAQFIEDNCEFYKQSLMCLWSQHGSNANT